MAAGSWLRSTGARVGALVAVAVGGLALPLFRFVDEPTLWRTIELFVALAVVALLTWWVLRSPGIRWSPVLEGVLGIVLLALLIAELTAKPTLVGAGLVVLAATGLVAVILMRLRQEHAARIDGLRAARRRVLASPFVVLPGPEETAGSLLAAERAIAPFVGRRAERAQLRTWWEATGPQVMIVGGPAGVGKSRLVLTIAADINALDGQTAGRWTPNITPVRELLDAVLACPDRALIVLDDADLVPASVIEGLLQQLVERDTDTLVKVILVGRSAAGLERDLRGKLPQALHQNFRAIELPALGQDGDRRRWFAQAARAYAAAIGRPPPQVSDSDPRPVGFADDDMMLIQARAWLAVFAHEDRLEALRTALPAQVAGGMVTEERRRWLLSAREQRWGISPEVSDEGIADAMLGLIAANPPSTDQAVELLGRIPGQPHAKSARRNLARWAHAVYPGETEGSVAPRPDFLAAALLAAAAGRGVAWVHRLHLVADASSDAAAAIRLLRAAETIPGVGGLLAEVLRARPRLVESCLVDLGLRHARPRGPLAETVLAAVKDVEWSLDDLRRLRAFELDWPDIELRLCELIVVAVRGDNGVEPAQLADSLNSLGNALSELGRYRPALDTYAEATVLLRTLAADDPARYNPELARSLSSLGNAEGDLGRYQQALNAHTEATALRRTLAADDPARYNPELARSLNNLGTTQSELGRYHQALDTQTEATALRRTLAAANPARHNPDLATSLNNLGSTQTDLGRYHQALDTHTEATALRRTLAAANPARHTPDLATSLNNFGNAQQYVGRHQQALDTHTEATVLHRHLAADNPARYNSGLAHSLNNLGNAQDELGRYQVALGAHAEAIALRRTLAADNPARYNPDLAYSLSNLGNSLRHIGRHQEALDTHTEATVLHRHLAADNPTRYNPDLARSLNNLGATQHSLGRYQESVDTHTEAVELRRVLAADNPTRYDLELTNTLTNRSMALLDAQRPDDAIADLAEAVAWWARLAATDQATAEASLESARARLQRRCSDLEHDPSCAGEAERLADGRVDAFLAARRTLSTPAIS